MSSRVALSAVVAVKEANIEVGGACSLKPKLV
jgi:hypothetical protein